MTSLDKIKVNNLDSAALATERRERIPGQFSAFIHLWRVIATVAVFIGHATKPDILFDKDIALIGRATIPTFLIISGFFTTFAMSSGGQFLKKVGKRYFIMLSMFVPAAFLIFFMDLYTISVDAPLVGTDKFDPDMSFTKVRIDIFSLFTFSGEYWSQSTVGQGVFSNQAMWIIDYIMAYTVMTGAIYLLTSWTRVFVLVAIIAIAGFHVLLLAPLWFAGVLIFEVQRRSFGDDGHEPERWHPITLAGRIGVSLTVSGVKKLAVMAMAAAVLLSLWIELSGTGEGIYASSKLFVAWEFRQHMGMSKRFLWQWLHVPSLFVVIWAARIIFDGGHVGKKYLRPIQISSQFCFPVFAMHFSTMYFIQALMPNYIPRHDSLDPYVMMGSTLVISVTFGYLYFKFIRPGSGTIYDKLFG